MAIQADIQLHVVHVPGYTMIEQGTDGLSRGIWVTPLHNHSTADHMHQSVFAPCPTDMIMAMEYARGLQLTETPVLHHWSRHWGSELFDHLSVWFPPPELARQCLIGILEAWVERPSTTSALLFIPRIITGFWKGLSRFIKEVDIIYPHATPMRYPPTLNIPIVVLYLPPHSRLLPTHRMVKTARPRGYKAHQSQANHVRGMSGVP